MNFRPVELPKIALVTGSGASTYRTGEVWHLLDREMGIPVTLVAAGDIDREVLDRHNVLVFSGARFHATEIIKAWVQAGGTLIVTGGGISGVAESKLIDLTLVAADFPPESAAFAEAREKSAQRKIDGAIVQASLDLTHPVAFGFAQDRVALLREGTVFLKPAENPYGSPSRYLEEPVVSGYVSEPNRKALAGSAAVQVHHLERGRIILFPDAPAFRGYWHGSARLLLNAIFLGPHMREDAASPDEE